MGMKPKPSRRLTKVDWQQAGFQALAKDGPEALKAEPMARRLGTTKGSFYWHFADVPAYHEALLSAWETQAMAKLSTTPATGKTPAARLRLLAQTLADKGKGPRIEPAIRAWAMGNAQAALAVARVDEKRMDTLRGCLSETGIDNPEMARIIYAAAIGMHGLQKDSKTVNKDTMGSLVDLVLALR